MVGEDTNPSSPLFDDYEDYMDYRYFQWQQQMEALRQTRIHSVRDTHFVHDVGKYATPSSNTWEAYSSTVRACELHFDPETYVFDKAIADASRNRAICDPSARHYTDYEPLRHNLAVLRNFVLNHIYGEEIDAREARDDRKFSFVQQIGEALGNMLFRGNNPLMANPFAPRITPRDANVEYDGAVAMYAKLLETQRNNTLLAPLRFIGELHLRNPAGRRWNLPPSALTPFGKLNYFAPPPTDALMEAPPAEEALQQQAMQEETVRTLTMDAVGTAFTNVAGQYNSIDSLSQPVKLQAIEIAREILEKLKLQFSGSPVLAMLDYTSGQFQRTMTDLSSVITVYKDHLQRACELDVSLMDDPMILTANEAVGFLGAQIKLRALDRAEMTGDMTHAQLIRQELTYLPKQWLNPNYMTSAQALNALEQGLNMVVATLALVQEEGMDQNQRGMMLQASLMDPQEQSRRMQSLSFDEQVQKIAAERRQAFITQMANRPAPALRPQGAAMNAGLAKKSSPATVGTASGASVFDTLLKNSGANMQQMQSGMTAPTSGNFTPAAPGSAQQTINQVISHRNQAGLRGQNAQRRDQQQRTQQTVQAQKQKKQKPLNAQPREKARDEHVEYGHEQESLKPLPPSSPQRPRGQQTR